MQNPNVKIKEIKVLADNWYTLRKVSYDYLHKDGRWQHQEREAYDRGNGAVILLYNQEQGTIVLTRQFRMPTYINGNPDGMMIEACAGILDEDDPVTCIKRETEEETGYKIDRVEKVMAAYMSPGSVTEILHFFIAAYDKDMKVNEGGGLEEEQENIEVLEIEYTKACEMIATGEICDAKTILLIQHLKLQGVME